MTKAADKIIVALDVATKERALELVEQVRAGIPKADLARAYGISRETVYQYLRNN